MERNSYSTYIVGRGKEYPFEFKLDAVFAAQELGIKLTVRRFKLTRKRRAVTKKRRDMRAVKAKRHSMTHLQMDVKYLTDIPNYWEQTPLGLPKYQYTVRETKTGMLFLGYSDELSGVNACTMIDCVFLQK